MFDNIGGKIKGLAYVVYVLSSLGSIILGAASCSSEQFILGFVIMCIGLFSSYVSACLIYGFGSIVENSDNVNGRVYSAERQTKEVADTAYSINMKLRAIEETLKEQSKKEEN